MENGVVLDQAGNRSLALPPPVSKKYPVTTADVGTQTECGSDACDFKTASAGDSPLFTLGTPQRHSSVTSSTNSSDDELPKSSPQPAVQTQPRDVTSCLQIFKSDVSMGGEIASVRLKGQTIPPLLFLCPLKNIYPFFFSFFFFFFPPEFLSPVYDCSLVDFILCLFVVLCVCVEWS